ncbi:arginine/lysine/ornithine decarboxylase [Clostridium acetobutylicum]|uniref:Lysine decarboxylase n=1 Tax=Clostridium acetobutylicum (strain ATCC 824 / DSM 792 / JCM 1419 / IAM 19013 / LMG 5710 / NBRC 13948 / NRRL B-527 / VKM B-1787 / 2291 / W) TaxID=272562 RepID=Q97MA1_CLOAB|nr:MULTISPECIES: aminotransferase class I/II-fold pyridoxal phosphate-dependent enzyme [Clostridium]AAK78278.1 Lysine decarboxylase [Clostridium acetobutylicum ATCC 824]ADZ19345.1 Lysine decarboxylase [Clostridium acetobutylicum EA 2018]AEI31155.1 lysine decarboxylase [Clostridium acetobutylicum DSM 1731]AWV80004.1 aminotransferase class V-fold PLP-dependent enzyme [Clostridium acetobutylicum]MBC2395820.1 aminotransferase class I/II-fold pyridoxal phosphate-dependent enzyme [Clostridium acetob
MSKTPIIDGIMKYISEKNNLFCTPGHKGGRGFANSEGGRSLYENIIKIDLTEVDGLDNLHDPQGIIKESEERLRDLYESKKSYFLVNGSTSGNLAMIFSCFNEGDKVIVERNCHKSIFNGIILRKLNPVYIKNYFDEDINAPLSIDEEYFFKIIRENMDAKGIILTYPNYYGVCCDLEAIVREAKKYNMKVLVDSAHGAHFGISEKLPESAVKLGADMVVMSCHKTLPSFTQTAFLHLCGDVEESKVDFYVSSFLSTSPSYMFMSSMDYARCYLEERGKHDYDNLVDLCIKYSKKINEINGLHVLGKSDLRINGKVLNFDATRLVINVEDGCSGFKLYTYLKENRIQPEMCDHRNVVLICSPFDGELQLQNLYNTLRKCNIIKLNDDNKVSVLLSSMPENKFAPYEVLNLESEKINIKDSVGKVCKKALVPYPPGIPVIMPGEVINENVVDIILKAVKDNITVLGIENRNKEITIDVVCED